MPTRSGLTPRSSAATSNRICWAWAAACLHGVADDIGHAAGYGSEVERRQLGIGRHHGYFVELDAQFLGGDLRQDGGGTLADIGGADRQIGGTVLVDLQKSRSRVGDTR